jgi:hypothetical protein
MSLASILMILSSYNAGESKSTSVSVRLPVQLDTNSDLGSGSLRYKLRAKATAYCMCARYDSLHKAIIIPSIAQLEERETVIGNIRAHLKVTGSIPVRGISFDVFGSTH